MIVAVRPVSRSAGVAKLTRAAPFAAYGSFVWSEYFSPRVGCKVFQGEYGFVEDPTAKSVAPDADKSTADGRD